jgi:hypothetical protein
MNFSHSLQSLEFFSGRLHPPQSHHPIRSKIYTILFAIFKEIDSILSPEIALVIILKSINHKTYKKQNLSPIQGNNHICKIYTGGSIISRKKKKVCSSGENWA